MRLPSDPIAAVTHPDPYPYYAALAAHKPIYRDETLGLWVASSADAVTAVLNGDLCRVRPPTEPIPHPLLGSPAADIFRHLVRMNDGPGHCSVKQAVATTLSSITPTRAAGQSGQWARFLLADIETAPYGRRLEDFMFRLPIYVIATLLGVSHEQLRETELWMSDFVRCLTPASDAKKIERGKVAAGNLLHLFSFSVDGATQRGRR